MSFDTLKHAPSAHATATTTLSDRINAAGEKGLEYGDMAAFGGDANSITRHSLSCTFLPVWYGGVSQDWASRRA
jgi:hypothetical protein